MARSQIVVTDIVRSGATPISATVSDATNKHYVVNDGQVYLEIVSSDGSSRTVTIKANPDLSSDGLTVGDLTITIAAGATRLCGPFRTRTFKQATDSDRMYVDPSVSTTLAIRAWRLEQVS